MLFEYAMNDFDELHRKRDWLAALENDLRVNVQGCQTNEAPI